MSPMGVNGGKGPVGGRCLLCGSMSFGLRRFGQWRTETVVLMRCGGCRSEFLSPPPSAAWRAEIYSGYYRKRGGRGGEGKRNYFRRLLRRIRVDFSGRKVCELGAGEGDAVAALMELWPSVTVTAVEANPECRPYYENLQCRLVNRDVEGWLSAPGGERYDAVLMFDLLEHLEDPSGFLSRLSFEALEPGAWVVATFPRVDGLSRRWMGRAWPQYKAEHLWYFSRRAVDFLAARAGLRTHRLDPLVKRLPLEYFLAVGSHFGPPAWCRMVRLARRFCPAALRRCSVPLRLGEWLWVARRNSGGNQERRVR